MFLDLSKTVRAHSADIKDMAVEIVGYTSLRRLSRREYRICGG